MFRLLSLSVDGKLTAVLQCIASAAVAVLTRPPPHTLSTNVRVEDASLSTSSTGMTTTPIHSYSEWRRANPVRTMVREIILRYPHILGTSLALVSERFASAAAAGVEWSAYLTVLRRSSEKHAQWLDKISASGRIVDNNSNNSRCSSGSCGSSTVKEVMQTNEYLEDTVLEVPGGIGIERRAKRSTQRCSTVKPVRGRGTSSGVPKERVGSGSGGSSCSTSRSNINHDSTGSRSSDTGSTMENIYTTSSLLPQYQQVVPRSSKLSQVLAWRRLLATGAVFPEYGPAVLPPSLPVEDSSSGDSSGDSSDCMQNTINIEQHYRGCSATTTNRHSDVSVLQIRSIFHNENRRVSASARQHLNALLPYNFLALD